jgi:hypothetical protein
MSEFEVKKVRKSALVTLHGRLPIHMPCSERFSTSGFLGFSSSGSGLVPAPLLGGGSGLPFLRRRRAFLEGGSGLDMSTSISSTEALRLFDEGSSEALSGGRPSSEESGYFLFFSAVVLEWSCSLVNGGEGIAASVFVAGSSSDSATFLFLLDFPFSTLL